MQMSNLSNYYFLSFEFFISNKNMYVKVRYIYFQSNRLQVTTHTQKKQYISFMFEFGMIAIRTGNPKTANFC